MKSIIFLIVSVTFPSSIYTLSDICHQKDETCKHYEQCPLDIQAMVSMKFRPQEIYRQLLQARCEVKLRKLCCKSLPPPPPQPECYTWDGRPGVCVPSNQANTKSMSFRQLRFSRCTKRLKFLCVSNLPVTQNPECKPTAFPPDPATGCCGKDRNADGKIAGGEETALDQFPWLAVLKYEKDKKNCTGALISGRYVLTAAHCVHRMQPIPYAVVLGEHNKTSKNDCDEKGECRGNVELTIGIEEIIIHEGFNPTNLLVRDDIALIRLIKMATYSDFVIPICLPIVPYDITKDPPANFKFWSAGWGDVNASIASPSDIKRKVLLPYVDPYECVNAYPPLNSLQLCAGGEAGKDSCYGDSGSPLMYEKNLTYEVLGITSHGVTRTCGTSNIPAIYTKVYPYNSWIHRHIRS